MGFEMNAYEFIKRILQLEKENDITKIETFLNVNNGEDQNQVLSNLRHHSMKVDSSIKWLDRMKEKEESRVSTISYADRCPECDAPLKSGIGGGVKCSSKKCDYWFCF